MAPFAHLQFVGIRKSSGQVPRGLRTHRPFRSRAASVGDLNTGKPKSPDHLNRHRLAHIPVTCSWAGGWKGGIPSNCVWIDRYTNVGSSAFQPWTQFRPRRFPSAQDTPAGRVLRALPPPGTGHHSSHRHTHGLAVGTPTHRRPQRGPAPKRAHAANFLNAAMVGWSLGQRPFRLMHSVPTPSQVFVASPRGTGHSSFFFLGPREPLLSFVMFPSSIFLPNTPSVELGLETVTPPNTGT